MENLSEIILGILFTNGESVLKEDILNKIDATEEEFNKAVDNLKERFSGDSGIVLLDFNNKLQLASNSKYSDLISLVLNPIRERNLSKAMLETIAIIAYKQPITRLEIEEIRGVNCDYAISVLMEHGLIEVVGRKDAVGRPVLFGTTDEFLKRFNLKSIDSLPDYDSLLEQIKVMHQRPSDSLYNEYSVPTDVITHSPDNAEDTGGEDDVAAAKDVIASENLGSDDANIKTTHFAFYDIERSDDNGEFV